MLQSWSKWSDYAVAALLVLQLFLSFVVVPLSADHPAFHALIPFGDLLFAAVCAVLLTRRHVVRIGLLAAVLLVALLPLAHREGAGAGYANPLWRESITATAFCFNLIVTVLVGLHTFGKGPVTVHRIQGAVLVYLNVAILFSIAYSFLEARSAGAIRHGAGALLAVQAHVQVAELTYFSFATITTSGYGDIVPVHALARSLANLEAVFGQLFPAIFLARVVALHLAHSRASEEQAQALKRDD